MSCKENSFSLHFSLCFLSLHLHSLPRFLFVAKKKLLLPNKKENLHKVNTHRQNCNHFSTVSATRCSFSCSVGPCLNSCRHQSSNAFKILRCCCNFIADTRERSSRVVVVVVVVECLLFLCCALYTLTKKVLTGSTRLGWRPKTEQKNCRNCVAFLWKGKSFSAQVEEEKQQLLAATLKVCCNYL